MIEGIPKISVLVITYNQEDVISRAIESLLTQKDYIYEICVSDDCSKDRTWEILQDYSAKNPGLFVLNRNEPNIGIFENIEKTWTMPTGDIIYQLSGDDECGEGWFEKVSNFVREKKLDCKNEAFTIYSDYKCVYPNGDSSVTHNIAIQEEPHNALRLSLRGIICSRGCCYSINVLKKFEKVSRGRSHEVEHVQDRLVQLNSLYNYYIPVVGNIYYASIGVSSHINEKVLQERLKIWPFTIDFFEKKGIVIKKKDNYFGKYIMFSDKYRYDRKYLTLLKTLWYYLRSRDFSLPYGDNYRTYIFALLRRLPHKKPITFK